jgi:nucleotide-binding universal stress UspA family protein
MNGQWGRGEVKHSVDDFVTLSIVRQLEVILVSPDLPRVFLQPECDARDFDGPGEEPCAAGGERWRMYRKILVPLDGSHKSELALPVAQQLAEPMGSEVCLLVAVDLGKVLFVDRNSKLPTDFEKLGNQQLKEAQKYLHELQERLSNANLKVSIHVEQTDPRDAIVNYATEEGVDLIVMASAGKSNWMRWISGSITDQVLRSSPCPVLVVRPPVSNEAT